MTVYRARIQLDWLPLPDTLLAELGWSEGDEIDIEVLHGPGQPAIMLTKFTSSHGPHHPPQPLKKGKSLSATPPIVTE